MTNEKTQATLSATTRQAIAELCEEAATLSAKGSANHTGPLEKAETLLKAAEIMLTRKQGTVRNDDRIKIQEQRLAVHSRLHAFSAHPERYFETHGDTMATIADDLLSARTEQLNQSQSDKARTLSIMGWRHHTNSDGRLLANLRLTQKYFIESLNLLMLRNQNLPNQLPQWDAPAKAPISMAKELMKPNNMTDKELRKKILETVLPFLEMEANRLNKLKDHRFQLAEVEYDKCLCYYELELAREKGAIWNQPWTHAENLLRYSDSPLPFGMQVLKAKFRLLAGKLYLQYHAIAPHSYKEADFDECKDAALQNLKVSLRLFENLQPLCHQDIPEIQDGIVECQKLIDTLSKNTDSTDSQ